MFWGARLAEPSYLPATGSNIGIGTSTPVGGFVIMNGNAGIGTWSPTSKLQVVGTVAATAFTGDGSALINLPASGGWTDGGTNVYTSATTDNVGIGTTTPNAATLEIVKNAAQPALKISSTATGNGDYLLVNSQGNVGIGTTTASSFFHVFAPSTSTGTSVLFWGGTPTVNNTNGGALYFQGGTATGSGVGGNISFYAGGNSTNGKSYGSYLTLTGNNDGGSGGVAKLSSGPGSGVGPEAAITMQAGGSSGGSITMTGGSTPASTIQVAGQYDGGQFISIVAGGVDNSPVHNGFLNLGGGSASSGNLNGGSVFIAGGAQSGTGSDGNVILNVTSGGTYRGNVGIGTVTPLGKLIVMGGNVGIGTSTPVGGLVVMNGNAGIGTWSPTSKLQVVGTVAATAFSGDGSGLTGISAGGWTDGGTNVYTSTTTDNVGIGTTTPTAALLIENAGTQDSFRVNDAVADGSPFVMDSAGNVGIGTTVADGKLVVTGGFVGIGHISHIEYLLDVRSNSVGDAQAFFGNDSELGLRLGAGPGATAAIIQASSVHTTDNVPLLLNPFAGSVGIGTTMPVNGTSIMNGNVGIGTWSPTQRLQVVGTVAATAFSGDGSALTNLPASGGWTDGGTNVYTSTTTDLVAIGTTTPASALTVKGNVGIGTTTPYTTIAAPANGMIVEGNVGIGTFAADNGKLIVMGGNVGIGTSVPSSKLSVKASGTGVFMNLYNSGNSKMFEFGSDTSGLNYHSFVLRRPDGVPLLSAHGDGNVGPHLYIRSDDFHLPDGNSGYTGAGLVIRTPYAVGQENGLFFSNQEGQAAGAAVTFYTVTTFDYGIGGLKFKTAHAAGSLTTRMLINEHGNVGISTTTPFNRFVVNGGAAIGTTNSSMFINAAAPEGGLIVENNVGIGTTTPVGALTVMNGNVGIGTWSPTSKLQVVGTVAATAFTGDGSGLTGLPGGGGWTDGGTNVYTSTTTDLVAIGTTTPASALTVKGNVGIGTTTPYTTIAAPANGMVVEGNVGIGTFAANSGKLVVMGGSVGIGKTNPSANLDIYEAGAGDAAMVLKSVNNSALVYLNSANPTYNWNIRSLHTGAFSINEHGWGAQNYIEFEPGLSGSVAPPIKVSSSGNVGIGASSPGGGLIVGNGNVGIGTNTPVGALTVMNGNAGIGTWSPTSKLQVVGTVAATAFTGDGSGLTGISAGGWTDGGTNVYTSATTDNVAIGTTTPTATLLVQNTSAVDSLRINDELLDSSPFVVDPAGNVGIGTSTSNVLLTVSGPEGLSPYYSQILVKPSGPNQDVAVALESNRLSTTQAWFFGSGSGAGSTSNHFRIVDLTHSNADRFNINPNGDVYLGGTMSGSSPAGTNMVILAGGNVGVGTTAPVGALTVMNGNAGIGTWSPRARVEVNNSFSYTSIYDNGNSSTSLTVDWTRGNLQKVTLTGNCTFTFTAPGGMARITLQLVQDGTGSRTVTWPAAVKWPGGSAPTLTTAASSVDFISCLYNGTNYYCTDSLDFR